jgi:hypothetical protein
MQSLALLATLMAAPAAAETWAVQYLAGSGGSRPIVVPKDEADTSEAFVENEQGERLFVSCGSGQDGPSFVLALFTPEPIPIPAEYAADGLELAASFGADPIQHDLGLFQGAQQRYRAPLAVEVFDRMMTAPTITLYATVADYSGEFSLAGFTAAAAELTCGE